MWRDNSVIFKNSLSASWPVCDWTDHSRLGFVGDCPVSSLATTSRKLQIKWFPTDDPAETIRATLDDEVTVQSSSATRGLLLIQQNNEQQIWCGRVAELICTVTLDDNQFSHWPRSQWTSHEYRAVAVQSSLGTLGWSWVELTQCWRYEEQQSYH